MTNDDAAGRTNPLSRAAGVRSESLDRTVLQLANDLRLRFSDELSDRPTAERAVRFFRAGLIPRKRPGRPLSEIVQFAINARERGDKWADVYAAVIPGFRTMDKYERAVRCTSLRQNVSKAIKRRRRTDERVDLINSKP